MRVHLFCQESSKTEKEWKSFSGVNNGISGYYLGG
jgi:hypothetical protein